VSIEKNISFAKIHKWEKLHIHNKMACFFEEEVKTIVPQETDETPIDSKIDPCEFLWKLIPIDYQTILIDEKQKPYFKELAEKVLTAYRTKPGKIFPHVSKLFRSLDLCHFDAIKIILLGQDPYHGKGQADGLCFSVSPESRPPPSLQNIFEEIERDLQIKNNIQNGDLSTWAKQGILLLNTSLSVEEKKPASHADFGWQLLTDALIYSISKAKKNCVFLLWGKHAQTKEDHIDHTKHLILKTSHPSPYSVRYGFENCKHFSAANQYLKENHIDIINWKL
jgi:uracil-DNA glycosylase